MTARSLPCPAKINLGLEVVGRREDGYHDLVTIFLAISLSDTLTVEPADTLTLVCSEPALATPDNLCLRAARDLQTATGVQRGARLMLDKRIPAAAGLGGGSSDAAATLRLLNDLWQTSLSDTDVAALALQLGADVPFFLYGSAALAQGVGDILTPLPPVQRCWLVLLTPPLTLENKTTRLYRALRPTDWSNGAQTLAQAERLQSGLTIDPSIIVNTFTRPLLSEFPAVADAAEALTQAGATNPFPAGSGPTLVALSHDEADAHHLAAALQDAGHTPRVCHSL